MDTKELLLIAFRATIVYFAAFLVVRLLGKREVGNVGPFDLVVALIIGESVDEAIYGDVSLAKFFVLIGTVAVWQIINSYLSYRSKTANRILEAQPTVLIEHGKIDQNALASERMNEDEVWSQLRMAGVEDVREVKRATLEPGGAVSVLLEEWAKPVQKKDLPKNQVQKEGEV